MVIISQYTFGVNAWKQWVMTKNAEIEKSSIRRKPFKSEILQLTADELNYSLCLFVKEVRKPNGSEYAPDTIYYLVLGKYNWWKIWHTRFSLISRKTKFICFRHTTILVWKRAHRQHIYGSILWEVHRLFGWSCSEILRAVQWFP